MNKRIYILSGIVALVLILAFGVTAVVSAQSTNQSYNYGSGGMMNGGVMGNGYRSGGMMSGGMMSSYYCSTVPAAASTQPLTIDEAKTAATNYLAGIKNSNLVIDEIMLFDNNAYVAIKDTSMGVGAFELLVNPATKTAFPEFGPNMMWNLLYGHMSGTGHGGMMGQGMMGQHNVSANNVSYQPGKMPVTAAQALQTAQSYLDKAYPGTKVTQQADEFPGYYTIDVETNDKTSGMLSVNGYSGQVWYHTWHGQFLQMMDYGG